MTTSGSVAESIASVRGIICQAMSDWDSSNPASMSSCEALLVRSAAELRILRDTIAAGIAPGPAIRLELFNIQSSVNRFLRAVDASSAFVAGISGMIDDRGLSYDAAGTACRVGSSSDGPTTCQIF